MEHLVINDVFDCVARYSGMIENPAYHDSVVGWIIVAEAIAGEILAPG